MPVRTQGYCGVGRGLSDSTGCGAMEEGLISSGRRNLRLPLGLALGSPIFASDCEGKLGVALESLQGLRDLT